MSDSKSGTSGSGARPEKRLVVLVDDERPILAALSRSLRDEPYEVLTASSAEEALEILGRRRVSLLVADQRMPGMCGADLFEEVRRRSPETRRVMLTGFPGSVRVNYGLAQEEFECVLPKPWDDQTLRSTILRMVG